MAGSTGRLWGWQVRGDGKRCRRLRAPSFDSLEGDTRTAAGTSEGWEMKYLCRFRLRVCPLKLSPDAVGTEPAGGLQTTPPGDPSADLFAHVGLQATYTRTYTTLFPPQQPSASGTPSGTLGPCSLRTSDAGASFATTTAQQPARMRNSASPSISTTRTHRFPCFICRACTHSRFRVRHPTA